MVKANLKEPGGLFCKCYIYTNVILCNTYTCLATKCNPSIELLVDGKSGPFWKTETLKKTWKPEWNDEFEL